MIGANLGSDVQDRVDAYRDNPKALQQRYMQSQELIDLLALQKMKSTQQNFARDMQLKMESNPKTIKEQLEAEMVGRTKDDMLKGVAGVLKNKQNQAQSNINKVASSGVAGQQASNMLKLAEGGIVGFKEGKEVEGSSSILDDAWYMIKSLATGLKKKDLEAIQEKEGDSYLMSYAKKVAQTGNALLPANILKTIGLDKSKEELNTLIKKASESPPAFGSEFLTKPRFTEEPAKDFTAIPGAGKMQSRDQSSLSGIAAVKPEDKKSVVPVDNLAADKSAGVPTIGAAPASTFDAGKFAMDDAFNQQVKGGISSLINQDPSKAVEFASRTPEEQAFIDKMLKERTDMRANMMDPDRLQTDRLLQTLLGAKGATPGEAFRTSGLAGINAQRAQDKLQRDEFDALNKLYMDEINKTQTLKKDAFKDALGAQKQGVASGTSLTASEQGKELEADKLAETISNNKVANSLKADLNSIQKQRNQIMATGNTVTSNTRVLKLYKDIETKQLKSLRTIAAEKIKNAQLLNKEDKDKTIADINKQLEADIEKTLKTIALDSAPFEQSLKELSTKTGGASNKFTLGKSNFSVSP
jgi:hypothetical protein